MKLYIVTLTSASTSPRKFFFVNAVNCFGGVEINNRVIVRIGDPEFKPDYNAWDALPQGLRVVLGVHNMSYFDFASVVDTYASSRADVIGEPVTRTIDEVTGDLRRWFMTNGLVFVTRSLSRIAEYMPYDDKRTLLRRVIEQMDQRYQYIVNDRPYFDVRATYKGRIVLYPETFSGIKSFCSLMGKRIAESLKAQEDLFSSDFMEEYDQGDTHNNIAQAANEAFARAGIELEIERQYCDHWDYPSNTSDVNIGRGRERSYCQACVQDSDVVVETYDTGILMLRDQAYWCDGNEEYYEHEPERDYDEDSDDESDDPDNILSYSTNVLDVLSKDTSFESSAFGEFHMGVELELVTSGYQSEAVRDLRVQLGEDYVICKQDGSLPSGGVEVVTTPRKLSDHIKRFKDWVIDSRYTAWNTGRCGMHVHIDSRAFTRLTLGKFIMFINAECNADFIRKIAGRHPLRDEQARSYCAAEGQDAIKNPSKALKGKSNNRYFMVNTTCLRPSEANRLGVGYVGERGFNTIELRIFRASLKKERLLAQLEFTHAVVMFCRIAGMRDLDGVSFLKWLKTTNNRYPHLSDWYGIRRRESAKDSAPAETKCADAV